MVQLPSSGKRRAEPATSATVKAEMEGFGCGDGPPHKRVRALPPPPPPQVVRRSATWPFVFPSRRFGSVPFTTLRDFTAGFGFKSVRTSMCRKYARLKATVFFRCCTCPVSRGSYARATQKVAR